MNIQQASITFNQQGTPIADQFDDVYFSNTNGLEESRYVFLHHNHLTQRWQNCDNDHFVIAESGFGTGLNFLVTWAAFAEFRKQNPAHSLRQLYFISIEKYPLNRADLETALSQWSDLAVFSQLLLTHYPPAVQGCHRLTLGDTAEIILDLHFGDVQQVLPELNTGQAGLIDAWYLDGFAPAKNPQMWTQSLFDQMARLGKQNSTFATFTAAGFVKRGLQQAGFEVQKHTGFGRKRDMLAGKLITVPARQSETCYYRNASTSGNRKVAIVGAGLAAANVALSLAQRGFDIQLYHQSDQVADGASGNPVGGFYPQLNADASHSSQFYASAFLFAHQRYRQLLQQDFDFAHQWCGALQLAFNQNTLQRYQKLIARQQWPKELINWLNSTQASEKAGISLPYPALWIEKAACISPPQLVKALLSATKKQTSYQQQGRKRLIKLLPESKGWTLHWQDDSCDYADQVIIASGHEANALTQLADLPLRPVRGQVERLNSTPPMNKLKTLLCHKGYFTPAFQGEHIFGSTYIKQDVECDYRLSEQQQNSELQAKALADCEWAQGLQPQTKGRAAIRCSTPDHLPLAGSAPDICAQQTQFSELYKALPKNKYPQATDWQNLFVLTGLGSRGLVSAPLLGEIIASQINGHPLPLQTPLLSALNPNRFLIRQLIRRQNE